MGRHKDYFPAIAVLAPPAPSSFSATWNSFAAARWLLARQRASPRRRRRAAFWATDLSAPGRALRICWGMASQRGSAAAAGVPEKARVPAITRPARVTVRLRMSYSFPECGTGIGALDFFYNPL